MWMRFCHFALLIWLPGVLDAQERTCSAPSLNNGYFLPVKETYSHQTRVTYACNSGYKPATEGWWATSSCHNGKWLQEPQCIEETACFPPTILNAKHTESSDVWYKDGRVIRIKCKEGYVHKDHDATAECLKGRWSSAPVCEKDTDACGVPPKVPNAVIKNEYQEVFAASSQVEYQCKKGYSTASGQSSKSIYCLYGNWDEAPTCSSSSSSRVSEEDTTPFIQVHKCGEFPVVENAVAVQHDQRSLRYRCVRYYKLVGPETVVCNSNGQWSALPACRVNFCSVDTGDYRRLLDVGVAFLENGDTMKLPCKDEWTFTNYVVFQCRDLQPRLSRCCNGFQIRTGAC